MRRFGRWIWNGLTALSLVACAAALAAWARSEFRYDVLVSEEKDVSGSYSRVRRTEVHSASGRLFCWRVEELVVPPAYGQLWGVTFESLEGGSIPWRRTPWRGVEWRQGGGVSTPRGRYRQYWTNNAAGRTREEVAWSLRHWWIALGGGALPLFRGLSALRDRLAAKPGRCARCGYDLTGNLSGVCPECGVKVSAAEPVKA